MRDMRPNNAEEQKAAIEASWSSITPQQCHRQLASIPRRIEAVIAQTAERQMCYASLDHSVRRKHKMQPKKKYPTLEMGENQLIGKNSMLSCIYLNSEQLNAENKSFENTSHVDSFREFGLKHNANDVMFQ
uniref:Uncharacterized protein n=1 Tax=Pseudonaja textilis TaxID=8673 RepID=A0A670Y2V0_PSETE